MTYEARLELRLSKELKDEFVKVCKEQDMLPPQILRKCIREYIKQQKEVKQEEKK